MVGSPSRVVAPMYVKDCRTSNPLLAEPWFQLAYQKSDSWPDSVVLCE